MADLVSAVVAAITLLLGWLTIRNSQLRKEEVVSWANQAIRTLQSLLVACVLEDKPFFEQRSKELIVDAVVETSVLIEQGRIYFRNEVRHDGHGMHKPEAYRGYRPRILDVLVLAHQIACEWGNASPEHKREMIQLLESDNKLFVSMVQKEIGRQRTVSTETKIGGASIDLHELLTQAPASARVDAGSPPVRGWI